MTALRDIAAYARALAALTPRGRAWPEAGGPVWDQLMRSLAPELRRLDARALALFDEADPRTCAETLTDWERVLALPDACTPGDATFTERRDAVVALLRTIGGASIAYFTALAARYGYTILIREHRPFICGLSECGAPADRREIGPHQIRFTWTVRFADRRVRWFLCGDPASNCGADPLARIDFAFEVECLFRRLKPAHTGIVFDYSPVWLLATGYWNDNGAWDDGASWPAAA